MYKQFKDECKKEIISQNITGIWEKTYDWMFSEQLKKYSYHFEWLGRPIIQYPQDVVQFQEIVWKTKPDLIIETGIAHGGSLILSASLLALIEYSEAVEKKQLIDTTKPNRMVLGIDIDIREHNKVSIENHPMGNRIKMIQGDSTSEEIAYKIKSYAKNFKNVMVCLDSNHTHEHVLKELLLYSNLTSVGNYCIVWDTIIEDMPEDYCTDRSWSKGNNPKTAVWEFLKTNDNFQIDKEIQNKLLITVAPDGYLKKIK